MNHQLTEAFAKRNLHNIRRIGKPPIWKYPRPQEILYRQFMIAIVNDLKAAVLVLLDRLPSIIAERDRDTHTDAWPDTLDTLLTMLRVHFSDAAHKEKVKARLLDIGQKTSDWNDAQWQKTLLDVLGVDVYRREQFLGSHLKSFVQEGSSLITKLTDDTYHDVATTITRGIRSGDRVESIKDAILTETDIGPGVFNKVETRARLIARDQVGKLNGELTRTRQEAMGVKEYIWHTALDERVRGNPAGLYPKADPSHYDREGETFSWDKPPEDGHPGEAIQCRCWAEAIFPEELTDEEDTADEDIAASNVTEAEVGFTRTDFDPDQPRDETGKWTATGGIGGKKSLASSHEKNYTLAEREAQHGKERPEEVVNRGTSPAVGPEDRGGHTQGGGEQPEVDIGESVRDGGRIIATHHFDKGNVYEVDNPQFYHDNLEPLIVEHKYGACVTLHDKEHYADTRQFISSDGRACFAIAKDGDLQSVIHMRNCKVDTDQMMELAIKQGAKKLDCFRTVLPEIYTEHGFKEIGHDAWNEQYKPMKPKEWDYELYKEYQNGRPDVVYMKLEGK